MTPRPDLDKGPPTALSGTITLHEGSMALVLSGKSDMGGAIEDFC